MNKFMDMYQNVLDGRSLPSPVEQLLGIRPVEVEPGRVVFELEATPGHSNPQGTLNGGIISTLADIAMGVAFGTTLREEESFTTIELKINFLKPVWEGKIRAEARVMKQGQTIGFIECDVLDAEQRLVAFSTSTCMILRGDRARGR